MSREAEEEQAQASGLWARWVPYVAFDGRTLTLIREKAPIVFPLLLVSLINAASVPAARHVIGEQVAAGRVTNTFVSVSMWIGLGVYPVVALVKGALLAALGWGMAAIVDRFVEYRRLLSTFLYAETALILGSFCTAMVLFGRSLRLEPGEVGGELSWGIGMFVEIESPVLASVAEATDIFHLIWLAFVWVALRSVTDLGTGLRAAMVVVAWLVLVVLGVAQAGAF